MAHWGMFFADEKTGKALLEDLEKMRSEFYVERCELNKKYDNLLKKRLKKDGIKKPTWIQ